MLFLMPHTLNTRRAIQNMQDNYRRVITGIPIPRRDTASMKTLNAQFSIIYFKIL